ncbi:hypothetical protein P7C70_g8618, partial [Phenoliferia sp. Uapishka_3]
MPPRPRGMTARKSTGGRPPGVYRPPSPPPHPIKDWGDKVAPIFPPEILLRIFNHTASISQGEPIPNSPTLRSLSLVSHQFRQLAQPLLFLNIRVSSETQALRILASSLKHPAWELIFFGGVAFGRTRPGTGGEPDPIQTETAEALISMAGKLGLKKLRFSKLDQMDARALENAGSELKYLEIESSLSDGKPGDDWTFPFQLTHLGIRDKDTTPPGFLSSLLDASPSLTSLESKSYPVNLRGLQTPNIFSLPAFPSCAGKITCFRDERYNDRLSPETLSHFTSLTHLSFGTSLDSLEELLQHLNFYPSHTPTITHLSIPLPEYEFFNDEDQELWKKILKLKVLESLEEINWPEMGGPSEAIPKCVVGKRVVRQTFGPNACWW